MFGKLYIYESNEAIKLPFGAFKSKMLDSCLITQPSILKALRRYVQRGGEYNVKVLNDSAYAILRMEVDHDNRKARGVHSFTVTCEGDSSGRWRIEYASGWDGDLDVDAQDLAGEAIDEADTLTGSDINSNTIKFFKGLGAFPMRKSGGVYFLPSNEANAASIDKYSRALEATLGRDWRLHAIDVEKNSNTISAVKEAYFGYTLDQVRDVIEKARKLTRQSAIDKRFDTLTELVTQMRFMESVFGFEMEDLASELARAEDKLAEIIYQLERDSK
jgi:hypothetical protein